jgi:hypothetical protein
MVTYTNPDSVTDVRVTAIPRKGQTVSGYGGAIPTRYLIRYKGVWRRVRVMVYGNSGSAYVMVKGEPVFIDTDTEYRLMGMGNE